MVEEIDIHHSKKLYSNFIERINKVPEGQGKEILLKYVSWHEDQLTKKKMSHSSVLRSLQTAFRVVDAFPKPFDISQKQLEDWFETETKRNKLHRSGGDGVKEGTKQISLGTIQKEQSQLIKFLKFVEFLKLNKPLSLFNSKRIPIPLIAQFCFSDTSKSKEVEPPLVSQDQIKEVIDYLLSTGNYIDGVTGVLVSYLNDSGNRLSESLSLRHENLSQEEGYWLVQIQQSKTATRTNIVLLSKNYLSKWLANCPTKNNKKGLIFCNKKGEPLSYALLRKSLTKALEKKGVKWKEYSSFHYLRHLAASRLYEMPQNLAEYYFGWSGKGMRATYSAYNWKACLPYLLKANRGNPMMDSKLSYMEETKSQEEVMRSMINDAVNKYLAIQKN